MDGVEEHGPSADVFLAPIFGACRRRTDDGSRSDREGGIGKRPRGEARLSMPSARHTASAIAVGIRRDIFFLKKRVRPRTRGLSWGREGRRDMPANDIRTASLFFSRSRSTPTANRRGTPWADSERRPKRVMAYIVMAYIVMAYIVVGRSRRGSLEDATHARGPSADAALPIPNPGPLGALAVAAQRKSPP